MPALRAAHAAYLRAVARACFVEDASAGSGAAAASAAASAALGRLLLRVDAFAGLCADFFRAAAAGELAAAARLLAALDAGARAFPRQVALASLAARQAAAGGGEAEQHLARLVGALNLNGFYEV